MKRVVVGLVLLNTPNTKGNARTRMVSRGCGVPAVSANGVVHTTLGGNARVKLGTGGFARTKRLIPSRVIVNVVGRHLTRSSYRGNCVLSNFPHAVPRTGTLSSVNFNVSTTLSVRITSDRVIGHVSNEHIYRGYNTDCRARCGGPRGSNVYGFYGNGLIVHGSSRPRAILGELGICRRRARPLGSCCGTTKGLLVIRNRSRIGSAAHLILTTLRGWG